MITVTDADGQESVGTGFHIGEGYFATARHVVDGFNHVAVGHTLGFDMIESIEIESIIVPENQAIDIAVLKTRIRFTDFHLSRYKSMPGLTLSNFRGIPFGALLDEGISDDHILEEVILIGYPRIPLSEGPELVAVKGEINATVRSYLAPDYYFHLISTVARGGFSGGPVIDSDGFLLGVFSQSFLVDHQQPEIGFAAVVSIEALLSLLKVNNIHLPNNRNILIENDSEDYEVWYESMRKL